MLDTEKPSLLIGSRSCTAFSVLMACNRSRRDPVLGARERAQAMVYLAWCCRLYLKQVAAGLYFLPEHPAGTSSWGETCVKEVMSKSGVQGLVAHQCQLGQRTDDRS